MNRSAMKRDRDYSEDLERSQRQRVMSNLSDQIAKLELQLEVLKSTLEREVPEQAEMIIRSALADGLRNQQRKTDSDESSSESSDDESCFEPAAE